MIQDQLLKGLSNLTERTSECGIQVPQSISRFIPAIEDLYNLLKEPASKESNDTYESKIHYDTIVSLGNYTKDSLNLANKILDQAIEKKKSNIAFLKHSFMNLFTQHEVNLEETIGFILQGTLAARGQLKKLGLAISPDEIFTQRMNFRIPNRRQLSSQEDGTLLSQPIFQIEEFSVKDHNGLKNSGGEILDNESPIQNKLENQEVFSNQIINSSNQSTRQIMKPPSKIIDLRFEQGEEKQPILIEEDPEQSTGESDEQYPNMNQICTLIPCGIDFSDSGNQDIKVDRNGFIMQATGQLQKTLRIFNRSHFKSQSDLIDLSRISREHANLNVKVDTVLGEKKFRYYIQNFSQNGCAIRQEGTDDAWQKVTKNNEVEIKNNDTVALLFKNGSTNILIGYNFIIQPQY